MGQESGEYSPASQELDSTLNCSAHSVGTKWYICWMCEKSEIHLR